MGGAGLRIAVPVAAAGPEQAQPERDVGEPGAELPVVTRVPGLHRIEPLELEPLDERAGPPILEVGDGKESPHRVHLGGDFGKLGQDLLHEGGAAAPDEAVERLTHVRGPAPAHDGPGDVRPPDGAAVGVAQDIVEVERDARALSRITISLPAADPVGPAAGQEGFQLGRLGGQEVPQHVHLAPGRGGAELAPAHHPDAEALAGGERLGNTGQGIVIGERDGAEAGRGRAPDHRGGRQPPVGGGRVDVEIDRRACRHLPGRGQRR